MLDLYARRFEGRRLHPGEFVICADEKSQLQGSTAVMRPSRPPQAARRWSSSSTAAAAHWPIVGDAALLFDPASVEAIAAAASTLLADGARAAELVRRGRERAAGFGWERTARGGLASYERALASASSTGTLPTTG